jgi:glycosyltransferase involved in cell wall biosynthesis
MIRINFDHQIFSLQRFGGATRYFMNLANSLLAEPETRVQIQLGLYDKSFILESLYPSIRGISGSDLMPRHGIVRFVANEIFAHWYRFTPHKWRSKLVHHCTYIYPVHLNQKTPLIVTHHDCTLEKFKEQFRRAELTIKVKRKIYQQANQIIAISNHSKNDLIDYYGIPENKIHVVYHGIEPSLPRELCSSPFSMEPSPYILYVGARTPYKNFNGLMKAFSTSKAKSDFTLVAAGGGSFTDSETALMEKLGIRTTVLGFPAVSQPELAWLYYNAHGMVYPSTYEGFGFPPLEAMSMGCPTLASNSSCLPEILGDGPLYFESGSDDDLAGQLDSLCYDQSLRDSLVQRGKQVVKRYTWAETANKTHAVYKAALA